MNIEDIILNGTPAEKKELWGFSLEDNNEMIQKKFRLFVIGNYPRYLSSDWADFHYEMIGNYIESYRGNHNFLNIGFRGCSKTSLMKLFASFIVLNDTSMFRKYIRVNTKEIGNSKQIVTDIYNLIIEVEHVYGDVFEKEGKKKAEETMGSFTMKKGIKVSSGTVGKTQRGVVQDAFRPDWVIFDDVEDNESVESNVITKKILAKCDEAIQGMSVNGSYIILANYISDLGVIEYFKGKDLKEMTTPIIIDGTPTWNRYSLEKIEKIKGNALDWWGDYMCQPAMKAREFQRKWFKSAKREEVEKMNTRNFLTVDSAVSQKDSADYTGFTINSIDKYGNWYLKSWHERLTSPELIAKLFYLWDKYKLDKIGIEKTSFVEAIKPFLEEEERRRGVNLSVTDLSHGGRNKESRIRGLLPKYERGQIYHIDSECDDLENELLRFPNSKNDDTVDSLAYQLKLGVSAPTKSMTNNDIVNTQRRLLKQGLRL